MVIVPIHKPQHWTLGVIDNELKTIIYYDSLGRSDSGTTSINALTKYLKAEYEDKLGVNVLDLFWTSKLFVNILGIIRHVKLDTLYLFFSSTTEREWLWHILV